MTDGPDVLRDMWTMGKNSIPPNSDENPAKFPVKGVSADEFTAFCKWMYPRLTKWVISC
jgi:hypothetical protein